MKKAKPKVSWTEANQAYLVAEFARIKSLLGLKPDEDTVALTDKAQVALEPPPAINRLTQLFDLSPFERDVLELCAGVEMDSNLAALCAEAQGHPQRTYATFGLATATLPEAHWSALAPSRPLRRFHLIEVEGGQGLTSAPLRIDERILHYLAGVNVIDPRLQPLLRVPSYPDWIADDHKVIAGLAAKVFDSSPGLPPVIHFCEDDPQGREDAAAVAAQEKSRCCTFDTADLRMAQLLDQSIHAFGAPIDAVARRTTSMRCASWSTVLRRRRLAERLTSSFVSRRSAEPIR